jgi:hypothetical protein
LGYKAQLLEFVELKIGLQFLEKKQDVLFLMLEAQNWYASRNFPIGSPIEIWKKSQPLQQHVKNDPNSRINDCQKEIF